MAEEQQDTMSASEKKKEDWMNSKWRPAMGWLYMFVCFFDFVLAPILWSLVQALYKGGVNVQWQPLTLQGAGLFHISMGAVLGLAAYGRTQEKLNGANNGGLGTSYVPPAPINSGGLSNGGFITPTSSPAAFSAPQAGGFGSTSSFDAPASTGFGSSPNTGTSSFGSSGGFGDTAQPSAVSSPSVKPIVRRPGT